ncbi:MAG: CAP domain-containing protein [Methanoregula sp.]
MSDNYSINRYHHPAVTPPGTTPKKKYLVLFLVLILSAGVGIAYYAVSSGLLADDNPQISEQMIARINSEREADNLPPVHLSQGLTDDAIKTSRDVRISPVVYRSRTSSTGFERENIFVIPKISWAISRYDSQQQLFTALENENPGFYENIKNPDYGSVGIGVSGDSFNYYVVTSWGQGP